MKTLICKSLSVLMVMFAFGACAQARNVLQYDTLMTGTYLATVDLSAYTADAGASAATNVFEGTLTLTFPGTLSSTTVFTNSTYVSATDVATAKTWPADFAYQFVQNGGDIIPVRRGAIPSSHGWWEVILEPGKVWNESGDNGYTRAAIPFSLEQKNANCTHNGVLMFLFKNDGSVSRTAMQITSETCLYLKLDMWGLLTTNYTPQTVSNKAALISAYNAEVANRMPIGTMTQLAAAYPSLTVSNFAIGAAGSRTLYGVVVNGTNYISTCKTRNGDYPYCNVMDLPSFSTAKSAFAGLALMRLQQLYANTSSQLIKNNVAQCSQAAWNTVTFANALNMATGNYDSAVYEVDESASKSNGLFVPTDHSSKITYSCGAYARKTTPGTKWVYHTSDTYVLGTAMNNYLKTLPGRTADDDYTNLILADIFSPLHLSPTNAVTRRTYDSVAQPFTGWGLTYHHDDVAKLGKFLAADNAQINGGQVLDNTMYTTAMQRNGADRGLQTGTYTNFKYKYGFWARNLKSELSCANATWVPFMSGFGGISVVIFPNGVVYYNFAEDGLAATFDWTNPAIEVKKISNYCQ